MVCERSPHSPLTLRARVLARIRAHLIQARTRRSLLDMPDHQLRDIGLTRGQAMREALRPIWDGVPYVPAAKPSAPASRQTAGPDFGMTDAVSAGA